MGERAGGDGLRRVRGPRWLACPAQRRRVWEAFCGGGGGQVAGAPTCQACARERDTIRRAARRVGRRGCR
jgi:hypothetical protein